MNRLSNYELLIQKLDSFIRKYYTNQIIRGSLYAVGGILGLFLLLSLAEYFFYFGTGTRKFMFFGFILASIFMVGFWVIDPIVRYFRLGKTISHDQAAEIIGGHFYNVKDKLLNILQLRRQAEGVAERSLIEASINQKSEEIKPVPFQAAIDLSKNRKYLRYALPPFLLLLVLLFAAPSLIKDSTHRLINNNKQFEKEAPFSFKIQNERLEVIQFGDFQLEVKTVGDLIPNEAFIEINDFRYRLKKTKNGSFGYTFKNVQKETYFRLFSGEVESDENALNIILKPSLANLIIDFDFPSYTGRKDESIANNGDMIIPEGTKVKWNLESRYTDNIQFSFSREELKNAERQGENYFHLDRRVRKNHLYKIYYGNEGLPTPDSVQYNISVIKDQFPTIAVEQMTDSLDSGLRYFIGSASDDYGLKEVSFVYSIIHEDGKADPPIVVLLSNPNSRSTNYTHVFDAAEFNLEPGDKVTYYFETKDNDAVNGSKSSKTGIMSYALPTIEQLEELEDLNEEQIKEDLLKSLEESKKIQEDLKKLRDKLLQKEEADWQDKKEMEKLLERQQELQKKMEEAKEKFDENQQNQEKFQNTPEDLQEKQDKLEELFEKVMDPERQDLMEKIQELLQDLQKENMIQMMEEFQKNEMTQEKEMERLLDLYKQLEMEKEITDMAEKLEEMAEKQEELAEDTEQKEDGEQTDEENSDEENSDVEEEEDKKEGKQSENEKKELEEEGKENDPEEQASEEEQQGEKSQEELEKEQEKLNEEFKEAMEKMEEMMKQNEELSPPKNLDEENSDKMEEIMEEMQQSLEQMQKQQNSKSSKSQKGAAQKMKSMASQMMSEMESGEMEQMQEDIAALRQLLENLVTLSFDQEDLTNNLKVTQTPTPRYVELVQDQFKLKNDFAMIEDSLNALASRVEEIESYVTEKVIEIKRNIDRSLDDLEERQVPEAIEGQRFTMKNVNDLALMLDESMQNMQQQMSGMMAGSQMCTNPGGQGQGQSGKVPMDKITQGQQGVGEKLGEMQKKQGQGQKLSSQDFAEAAARQAALRKALQELNQSKKEQGKGAQELQDIIDQMDKIETDLVNKKLDNELLMRQQQILTRLLEAEKAEQQREFDNKRKAEQAVEKRKELPPALQDYLKSRESEIEMYKTISPDLNPYYKILVDSYYRALKGEK